MTTTPTDPPTDAAQLFDAAVPPDGAAPAPSPGAIAETLEAGTAEESASGLGEELGDAELAFQRHPELALLFVGNPANIFANLSRAQAEFLSAIRSAPGQQGNRTFKYAPLDVIQAATRPALTKYGLAILHIWTGPRLFSVLGHASGSAVVCSVPIPTADPTTNKPFHPQELGKVITYFKRYNYQALTDFVADDDLDSHGGPEAGPAAAAGARPPIQMPQARPAAPASPRPAAAAPVSTPPAGPRPAPRPATQATPPVKATPAPPADAPGKPADNPADAYLRGVRLVETWQKDGPGFVRTSFKTDAGQIVYTFSVGATHADDGTPTLVAQLQEIRREGAPVSLHVRQRGKAEFGLEVVKIL